MTQFESGMRTYNSRVKSKILSVLDYPLTYEEMSELTGMPIESLQSSVKSFRERGGIMTVNLELNHVGHKYRYGANKILGKLTGKAIVFLPDQGYKLGEKISRRLPTYFGVGIRKSITERLIPRLPEKKSVEFINAYASKAAEAAIYIRKNVKGIMREQD